MREISTAEFAALRDLLLRLTGIALNDGKRELVRNRLARRLRELGLESYGAYYRHLCERDPASGELREMVNALTTNKTSFFREPYQFDWMAKELLPDLKRRADQGGPRRVRVWSAGCSTGAEPYTIAMVLRDALGPGWNPSILATDIDTDVLAAASHGIYEGAQLEGLDPKLVSRHFLRGRASPHRFKVRPALRDLVTFRQLNLIEPWNLTGRFDLIFCRNVAIYFHRETQSQLFRRMAALLHEGGHLLVGHSECLAGLGVPLESMRGNIHRRPGSGERRARAPSVPPIQVGGSQAGGGELLARMIRSVAVCVYDPSGTSGGLAHLPAGGSGAEALPDLVQRLRDLGAVAGRLEAKVVADSEGAIAAVRQTLDALGVVLVDHRAVAGGAAEVRFFPAAGRVRLSPLQEPA